MSTLSSFADSPVLVPKTPGFSDIRSARRSTTATTATGGCAGKAISPTRSCWPAIPPAATWRCAGPTPARVRRAAAALVAMSPLLQLATQPKTTHPTSARMMFPPSVQRLPRLNHPRRSTPRRNGHPDALYEPLDHIQPGLPPTLIHVSGCEVLLHDAQLAAQRLATAGVPVEVQVWPGQVHVFQLAAPMVPEAHLSSPDRPLHPRADRRTKGL